MSIKNKIITNQPITYRELLAHELKDSKFLKAWDNERTERELGKQIIQARIDRKLSQRALAKKAGTTQAVISRIESNSVSPSLRLVSKIAAAMGKRLELKFV